MVNRTRHLKPKCIIPLLVLLSIAAVFYAGHKPVWQFDRLERNAQKVITGSELQSWATNLLAHYPTNTSMPASALGTNFPQQLLGLAPKLGPHVYVYEGNGTHSPSWVRLYWGSGMLGAHGFEIGPTNFVSSRSGHSWQPGVYFYDK